MLGGDLTAAPALSVSVTAVGHAAAASDLVGRRGAIDGHALCVTGELGGAAAGLMLLEHPDLRERVPERAAAAAISRQLDPRPRLEAGRALAAAGAAAMIDVSDGLGADAEHLAAASGLGAEIDLERVPLGAGVAEVAEAAGRDAARPGCVRRRGLRAALRDPAVSARPVRPRSWSRTGIEADGDRSLWGCWWLGTPQAARRSVIASVRA